MTPEGAVRAHLVATSAVTAIVSSRIYLDRAPQTPTSPYVLVRLVTDPGDYHLRGADRLTRARVQVEACADESATTRPTVDALVAAIDAALSGQAFDVSERSVMVALRADRRALYEPDELRILRIIADFIVWSHATA